MTGMWSAAQESAGVEHEDLGVIWVKYIHPTPWLRRLEKALRGQAILHRGQELPCEACPSLVVLCADENTISSEASCLLSSNPDVPIVIFGPSADPSLARAALRAGTQGFVHAEMSPEQIIRALAVAEKGEFVIPREVVQGMLAKEFRTDTWDLTHRQLEILQLVAGGLSNIQIVARLYLSESTVKHHLTAAYKVMGVKNRKQAAVLFRRNRPGQISTCAANGGSSSLAGGTPPEPAGRGVSEDVPSAGAQSPNVPNRRPNIREGGSMWR